MIYILSLYVSIIIPHFSLFVKGVIVNFMLNFTSFGHLP